MHPQFLPFQFDFSLKIAILSRIFRYMKIRVPNFWISMWNASEPAHPNEAAWVLLLQRVHLLLRELHFAAMGLRLFLTRVGKLTELQSA